MQRLNVLAINLAAKVSMSEPPPADVMMKVRRCQAYREYPAGRPSE